MNASQERLFELLATKATEGLSQEEADSLDNLLIGFPEVDPRGFDRAAAAVHLALLGPEQTMPTDVKLRLVETGERQLGPDSEPDTPPRTTAGARLGPLGWWAAAAVLTIAVLGWWPRLQPDAKSVPQAAESFTVTAESLAQDPATLRLTWTATEDSTAVGASGEVIWNNERQAGFMRFAGLEVNDPTEFQYQLWIFDRARDERYPVDGGVFDVSADGTEIVVPIDAKIDVSEPYLFAVTVERPGGVVVSTRERIALIAQA